LLAQSHRNLTVVAINDGDPDPPWRELADIADPRLVRFSLEDNHGPYFASAVVLNATAAPYFLIQDADDWSDCRRVELLLGQLERERSDFAFSAVAEYEERPGGRTTLPGIKWRGPVDCRLASSCRYRAPHHGLFRRRSLDQIGGYYGGFPIRWDVLIVNLIMMIGKVSHCALPLYCRLLRSESLMHSAATGLKSRYSDDVRRLRNALYDQCYLRYREYLAGRISCQALTASIRSICSRYISDRDRWALVHETARLADHIARRYIGLAHPRVINA
jgi:glycosyltransferase involved in cell wall biosynthesis